MCMFGAFEKSVRSRGMALKRFGYKTKGLIT